MKTISTTTHTTRLTHVLDRLRSVIAALAHRRQTPGGGTFSVTRGSYPLAGLVAITVLVAGCGGPGSASKTPGAGSPGPSQQNGVAFASCMRSHGLPNFPDNAITVTSRGLMLRVVPGMDPNSPQFQSAAQSCQQYLPKTASGGSSPSSGSSTQAVLKFANCMRSHGVKNFPEPDSQGHVLVQGGGDLNPKSPQYQSAMQACRHLLPANAVGSGS